MADGVFVAYLFNVGKNCATFATSTFWENADSEGSKIEIRSPSMVKAGLLDEMLYGLDREAKQINNWKLFYQWLGRGNGWSSFTEESALMLVPHWSDRNTMFRCVQSGPTKAFLDIELKGELPKESIESIVGDAEGGFGQMMLVQLTDNFVITTQPLFPG